MAAERYDISKWSFGGVVGNTPDIRNIFRIIQLAAKTAHPVLIVGEPGTGKEVIAKAIHSLSANNTCSFRVRRCTNLRPVDLERELVCTAGPISVGGCRTLFLDQIVSLNLELQGILLRALDHTESSLPADCQSHQTRIIAASTRDLTHAVSEGIFRRDLYFRLNALTLRVPPLRERRQDIPILATALLRELSNAAGNQFRLSDSAVAAVLAYEWPGNVRELKDCLERACCSCSGPVIKLIDLPVEVRNSQCETDTESLKTRIVPLSELERQSIAETLELVRGNKLAAARLLGIGKTTLYRKLKQYESQRQTQ